MGSGHVTSNPYHVLIGRSSLTLDFSAAQPLPFVNTS
jgi:hypothetical protein